MREIAALGEGADETRHEWPTPRTASKISGAEVFPEPMPQRAGDAGEQRQHGLPIERAVRLGVIRIVREIAALGEGADEGGQGFCYFLLRSCSRSRSHASTFGVSRSACRAISATCSHARKTGSHSSSTTPSVALAYAAAAIKTAGWA
jgi:hypothetical protein